MRRCTSTSRGWSTTDLSLCCALILLQLATPSTQDRSIESHPSAGDLARQVVHNEVDAQDQDKSLWKYRQVREEDGNIKVLEIAETKDGEMYRLLAVNGQSLSGKERQDEDRRIEKIVENPSEFQERQKNARHDAEQERKLLTMLPDAFVYQYDGTDGGRVKLKFLPNPNFRASDRESEVFHHMEGTMLVDPRQNRLAEIDGRLVTEVKFWGGLLGHLDKGGTFTVKQEDVGGGHWQMVELNVQMSGRALLFKTIAVHEKLRNSDFQPLPDRTTIEQASKFLAIQTGD